jgi:hypothetical protein
MTVRRGVRPVVSTVFTPAAAVIRGVHGAGVVPFAAAVQEGAVAARAEWLVAPSRR